MSITNITMSHFTSPYQMRLNSRQALVLLMIVACLQVNNVIAQSDDLLLPNPPIDSMQYTLTPVLLELNAPWAIKTDAQSRAWITLLSGQLIVTTPITPFYDKNSVQQQIIRLELPQLYLAGQGGLMDVLILDSSTEFHKQLLFTYAKGTEEANAVSVVQVDMEWNDAQNLWVVAQQQSIFTVPQTKSTPVHYGARLAQLPDASILLTVGDGFDWREQAQNIHSPLGKVLRFDVQGQALPDNPYYGMASDQNTAKNSAVAWVYSMGHRNAQGLLVDHTGQVWSNEHGPAGGDEINLIRSGANFGWPVVTQGIDYSGAIISPFADYPDMHNPIVNWTPSIAPSGMSYYQGLLFPELEGHFMVTSLKDRAIYIVQIADDQVINQTRIKPPISLNNDAREFNELAATPRLRDITHTSTGQILILSDGDSGQLLQLKQVITQPLQ